ncbi:glycosyltransferase family 4 protein [Aerococcus urinaeequi]|uniref:glycosyltransferase family 4 protein n=1 Tax=Aerococcus urinaeequi TaxID=51665 RepID=UPI003D6B6DEC
MNKVLITATVASMIDLFNMDNIKILQNMGYQVDVAANFKEGNVTSDRRIEEFKNELESLNVGIYHIGFTRKAFAIGKHLGAYRKLVNICKDNNYDFIHTQTPIAGALTRLVANNLDIKVVYMAHGFHFYDGAPKLNWFIYYPVEKYLSKVTNTLITINNEDFERSKSFNAQRNIYVPGVGVDLDIDRLSCSEVSRKKEELDVHGDNIFVSVGELNDNKNHRIVIEAFSKIENNDYLYLIVGKGPNHEELQDLIEEKNLTKNIRLIGYRSDILEILQISNVFIFPSFREGLSKSLMEAMAVGLPAIVSNIRGNTDLIDDKLGGYLFEPDDVSSLKEKIVNIINDNEKKVDFSRYNINKIKLFSIENVNNEMERIYSYLKK